MGSLEARLARGKNEIRKAQRLRYDVFYKEGGAIPDARTAFTRRDADRFDKYCDHLIVIDHEWKTRNGRVKPKIVGAYRLLRGDMAQKAGGFYSAGEYDIAPLLARHAGKRILELGRSCVLESHRSKRAIELLWRGLLAYIRAHRIDVLIGCASFPGVSPRAHAEALSYLAYYAGAEGEWRVRAHSDLYLPMAMISERHARRKERARGAVAADQGLSAARRALWRRRRGGHQIQHDGCFRGDAGRPDRRALHRLFQRARAPRGLIVHCEERSDKSNPPKFDTSMRVFRPLLRFGDGVSMG